MASACVCTQLVAEGGLLLTLQFPMKSPPGRAEDDFASGPPFLLKESFYHDALDGAFVLESSGAIDPALSDARRKGAERYAFWRRVG